jgi:hypothetical protein
MKSTQTNFFLLKGKSPEKIIAIFFFACLNEREWTQREQWLGSKQPLVGYAWTVAFACAKWLVK